jgi:hypothetical protein
MVPAVEAMPIFAIDSTSSPQVFVHGVFSILFSLFSPLLTYEHL